MKTILAEKIILLAFMATACSVRAGAPVWFEAPELPEAPRLESGLKDPAWAKALRVPLEKSDGEIGRFTTESCWLYAGGSLFVGFKCANPDSPRLHAVPNVPRDQPIYTKESIELFLGSW